MNITSDWHAAHPRSQRSLYLATCAQSTTSYYPYVLFQQHGEDEVLKDNADDDEEYRRELGGDRLPLLAEGREERAERRAKRAKLRLVSRGIFKHIIFVSSCKLLHVKNARAWLGLVYRWHRASSIMDDIIIAVGQLVSGSSSSLIEDIRANPSK